MDKNEKAIFTNIDSALFEQLKALREKYNLTQRAALESILEYALPRISNGETSRFIFREAKRKK